MSRLAPLPHADADADSDADLAPRPRPGWRSREANRIRGAEKAHLVAGVLRAGAGCAGLFAALLYLPIQTVTPVLAGISILMMVTGCTSSWRAVSDVAELKIVPRLMMAGCALATVVTLLLTVTLGAGSFGPIQKIKQQRIEERAADNAANPTVSFQPTP